ncbi:ubiquinone biosynthesis protein COQ9 [Linderina pennispora]|uniref:Ubiquinone biosynthesis protein n=1 Tax=Linderina pennispora TaxID=61395 RepID=A0A1Y1W8B6_9FUNG|nr:ubiquinone biosynthesis protein COQ9 [Linderina pennispora]KAJ1953823.1 Ubiquinone biosynthesis protein coq9, mitochondrial [Linderina pennispora]ORX69692.1 ubiquinone biosynthesis protein COQ9 [Linderina pennispora]
MNSTLLRRVAARAPLRRLYTTPSNHNLEILDHALTKVNELGWTRASVIAACQDLGYSSMAHGVSESGGLGLVRHFMDRALDETTIEVDDQLHEFDSTNDKLRFICITRLRQTLPYANRWHEAAALLAQPQNVPTAIDQMGKLASRIWYLAGDQSVRLDWYAKRSALAAAYVATEMYMCEDKSPDHAHTWRFLNRRIEEMGKADKLSQGVAAYGTQFGRNLYNILASRGFVPHQ